MKSTPSINVDGVLFASYNLIFEYRLLNRPVNNLVELLGIAQITQG